MYDDAPVSRDASEKGASAEPSEKVRLLERELELCREEGERKDRAIANLARANAELSTALIRALEDDASQDRCPRTTRPHYRTTS